MVSAVLPGDNTFFTLEANLSDPLFKVSPSEYNVRYSNIAEVEGALEGDEGVAFCLGDFCFSGD